tara:strand:- start:14123 stop:14641 length:519 start_codon:yes stop_codon:yes gene_type:complete
MNTLDLCILAFLSIGAVLGWRKGLIMELFTFGSLLAGVYFAFHFSDTITQYFVADKNEGVLVAFLSFLIVFIIVVVLVRFLGKLFEKFVAFVWLSIFNKIFGALVGVFKWGLLAGCALLLLGPLDPKNEAVPVLAKESSVLYPHVMGYTTTIVPGIKNTLLLGYREIKKEID